MPAPPDGGKGISAKRIGGESPVASPRLGSPGPGRDVLGHEHQGLAATAVPPGPQFVALGRGTAFMEIASADAVFDDYAALTSGQVFEADDDHAVASETSPLSLVAVFGADTPGGDELEVAGRADVRGMVVALQTVESS
ncbi:MAG: hypothetical protein FRX48_02329 [Lasallia pustulata]|uniref:Cupin domain-containing protein n=1 Tax=Lasallia pustulata TaxID=136370 RepID=A0A5M8PWG7_9LECA|nr:MAG: hypothetical protein FRX48_02329 [Lasallia pustulata]